ncbi:transcriptional regulator [Thalassospira profundimaris]|uniref:Transcriptional regulator n=2 Tax=Thalassospiraceae TaxID=2844866 RepID=A0A8I1M7V0_9PROT|nr:transcriptional regulator [Thalassospira sp. MCCC 1A02491]MAL41509.1 transcriptional regulator [Thalassospira sp.]MBN8196933.1 transcriptional regulator [Thalassospira povalilytica]RCK27296.1 transcriptional regulator [Thalassospira profundimaris]MBO6772310.1 transcriptional regulator [Thalassospira sp.]|tara:strand:+ start:144 stop:698 length:555 start_codon:yes stop_codon:yes gene_type:complete|eukprot:NODE_246_length_2217_cov_1.911483_g240_i0.p2 GENE.NODE_246_length_2217_cov_1.911483_g240_i0~~NODE_246_length_2217_cov_1.911483_g240_i0.p2  ORF type:complete len:185 (-),score=39.91 NODE_246_length_2217_cov_1.911483_g240_i0:307-861(-)
MTHYDWGSGAIVKPEEPMKKKNVQIIPAQTDLKRRAVNFVKGFDINLSPEQLEELEKVVQRSSETFVRDIGKDLMDCRRMIIQALGDKTKRQDAVATSSDLAYSVKALGGTFQYPLMTQIAKSMENFVADRTTANEKQLLVIQLHIDSLYVILAGRVTGFGSTVEQATVAALTKLAERYEQPRE